MSALFKKMNLKDQKSMLVLNKPESFDSELSQLQGIAIHESVKKGQQYDFFISFVKSEDEISKVLKKIQDKFGDGDLAVWFAYPKKTSKKYKATITRDHGWGLLGELGFEPVKQIAIDDDWSAVKFRHIKYIKNFIRSKEMALSKEGKKRGT